MRLLGKRGVQVHEVEVVIGYAAHVTRGSHATRYLVVAHLVRNLVGNDLPAAVAVQRDGVREENGERLVLLAHAHKALAHKPAHDALASILRVGGNTRDETDLVDGLVNVHLQRVDGKLRDKAVTVVAPQDVGTLDDRELGLLDGVVAPTVGHKLLLGHLEGIAQQRVVLVEVIHREVADDVRKAVILRFVCVGSAHIYQVPS